MTLCIRCGEFYREPYDEQGDHDCPGCGLTPEMRDGWWDEEYDDEDWDL